MSEPDHAQMLRRAIHAEVFEAEARRKSVPDAVAAIVALIAGREASSDRLEITREDAERLLCAIDWTEGEGQGMLTTAEVEASRAAGWSSAEGRAILTAANAAHDDLKARLEAFLERTSPDEPRSREAGVEP